MKRIATLLLQGEYYFGSGSYNSDEFNDFFEKFKRSFTNELKKVNATNLQFSKGHFYISGFFTIGEQPMYFSISDVRWSTQTDYYGQPQMLVRQCNDYQDFTGKANNYVTIEPNMSKKIASISGNPNAFNPKPKKEFKRKEVAEQLIDELKENGSVSKKFTSAKRAMWVAWSMAELLNIKGYGLQEWKRGRYLVRVVGDKDGLTTYFDASTKTLTLTYGAEKLDLETISKEGRQQSKDETLSLLNSNKPILWSWGASNFTMVNDNILKFSVNGNHHKGLVYIAVNGSDLFDIYLTDFNNTLVKKIEDKYFDELVNAIDVAIEKVGAYSF